MRHSLWWDHRLRWWDWHMEPIRTWLPRFMTPVPTSDPQINTHYTFLLLIIRKKLGKGVIWQWLIGRLIGIILETGKPMGITVWETISFSLTDMTLSTLSGLSRKLLSDDNVHSLEKALRYGIVSFHLPFFLFGRSKLVHISRLFLSR
jgi:hypothetical protein